MSLPTPAARDRGQRDTRRDRVAGRISQPPLKDIVEYVGYVADDAREALFAGARALVLPSLDEGFGLPALEAMSAGVPVVASNAGPCRKSWGLEASSSTRPTSDGWAAAIERVTGDAAWARDLACAGLDRAKAFTWARHGRAAAHRRTARPSSDEQAAA